jgi:uncharacterized protein
MGPSHQELEFMADTSQNNTDSVATPSTSSNWGPSDTESKLVGKLIPELVGLIASEMVLSEAQVASTVQLILDDCTVPFIARYRKERTGNLDEVQIRDIRDRYEYLTQLEERKVAILRSIEEQGKLTPDLKHKILACKTKNLLEDIYLPFKPKKRTRGQIAKERGLEPLALSLLSGTGAPSDLPAAFEKMVGSHEDLKSLEDVKKGCKDYVAEVVSEVAELRQELRDWVFQNARFQSAVKDEYKEQKTKYNQYYDFSESVKTIAAHRLMALRRAEKEEVIRVSLSYDTEPPLSLVERYTLATGTPPPLQEFLRECAKDAFDRILSTATETEIRLESKSQAEEDAIKVFSKNLRNLLLLPPIPSRTVMGVDPGIRTGSKIVVVDPTGKLLHTDTVHPVLNAELSHPKNQQAIERLFAAVKKYQVECISVGNGTGCREVADLVQHMIDAHKMQNAVKLVVVNESGASVYSASDIAREEFPELDVTLRGSVSIARRLQDPLAEFVKIDPKSIGVGQYQHDVNQSRLKKSLSEVVESCVNYVGVNLNTASASLLSYVAGIGPNLAKTIVREREARGRYASRKALLEIHGFGPKAFEQSAGFLRIPGSEHPLDNTAVHPESYAIVEGFAQSLGMGLAELVGNREAIEKIRLEDFVTAEVGLPTLKDIVNELKKPGRDPREDGATQKYSRDVRKLEDLKEGQILEGTVTNVTNFGAFVDIGVHQDGLVHVSELSADFVKDASEAIAVGARVKVKVIGLDLERKRISLSCKACIEGDTSAKAQKAPAPSRPSGTGAGAQRSGAANARTSGGRSPNDSAQRSAGRGQNNRPQRSQDASQSRERTQSRQPPQRTERPPAEPQKPASLSELMEKFKSHKV